MKFKGTFKQKYTLDRVLNELVVEVKLHEREGMVKSGQNLYYGTATVDGKELLHKSLSSCVNAELMATKIGKETIESRKIETKGNGNTLRLKRK